MIVIKSQKILLTLNGVLVRTKDSERGYGLQSVGNNFDSEMNFNKIDVNTVRIYQKIKYDI